MASIWYTASILIGCGGFVMAVLAIAVSMNWLSASLLMNVSDSAWGVYATLASGTAIGLFYLSKNED
jgi:hypothetical protein